VCVKIADIVLKMNLNPKSNVNDEIYRLTGMPTHAYKLLHSSKIASPGVYEPQLLIN